MVRVIYGARCGQLQRLQIAVNEFKSRRVLEAVMVVQAAGDSGATRL